ncbi:hypothetical protein C8J56DRAFT_511414 [Mycena floridula]|nr:hypothetical protein C8J56DRAFT_511414 [Mycena floridula]
MSLPFAMPSLDLRRRHLSLSHSTVSRLFPCRSSSGRRFKANPSFHVKPGSVWPLEMIGEVAEHIEHSWNIRNFSLVSKDVYWTLAPLRYRILELMGNKRCMEQLCFLIANPHFARHVRVLILHPHYLHDIIQTGMEFVEHIMAELNLIRAVEILAPNLHSLEQFEWNGWDRPQDGIWKTLRECCPRLKYIGSRIGLKPMSSQSEMFRFTNLRGFSLKCDPRKSSNPGHPTLEELPQEFWDMLLKRCPQLEHLTLGCVQRSGFLSVPSMRLFDILPLQEAKLPRLLGLTIHGGVWGNQNPTEIDFLVQLAIRHRGLKQLHIDLTHINGVTAQDIGFISVNVLSLSAPRPKPDSSSQHESS